MQAADYEFIALEKREAQNCWKCCLLFIRNLKIPFNKLVSQCPVLPNSIAKEHVLSIIEGSKVVFAIDVQIVKDA